MDFIFGTTSRRFEDPNLAWELCQKDLRGLVRRYFTTIGIKTIKSNKSEERNGDLQNSSFILLHVLQQCWSGTICMVCTYSVTSILLLLLLRLSP
jgi:hypothetical protein